MTLEVEVFWSFRSPYSYLATPRLAEIARTYDVELSIRPVYPLAVRVDGFFDRQDPRWPMYVVRDCFRTAQMLGMTFGPPRPDPIVMNMATREIPKDQPYIRRLTHLGQAAVERGQGLPFICEVSRLIWSGEVDGWDKGDHLAEAAARAGLDLADLDRTVAAEGERLEAAIQASHDRLESVGHWGVPTFVFQDEPFFGQDRIETLLWRMRQQGLKEK
ncbi:MAG: 2-hydroxychromene-2-carboxylate isomerase [Phenylobacterium sp.]|uniref:2-hydroxychromene-2-carboxylate isomerase n=1 Tax=Phenylobacterium sp. TaxID=1871053 RepID=UPI001A37DF78|nr:2-hydroxychromene-2-carboxylate isomerase [Phenylobacterium sp.]MBL8773383.1 2-hydroxychromene-2-carboxylate isomerase [Phenylobacterium sp.]